jgi:hypothetical protein
VLKVAVAVRFTLFDFNIRGTILPPARNILCTNTIYLYKQIKTLQLLLGGVGYSLKMNVEIDTEKITTKYYSRDVWPDLIARLSLFYQRWYLRLIDIAMQRTDGETTNNDVDIGAVLCNPFRVS